MTPASRPLPDIVYERKPDAASSPPPASYRRREPGESALHRVPGPEERLTFAEALG